MGHYIYIKYLFVKLKESHHLKGAACQFKGAPHHFKVSFITLKVPFIEVDFYHFLTHLNELFDCQFLGLQAIVLESPFLLRTSE